MENNENNKTAIGTCWFCGQQRYVEHVTEGMDAEQINILATDECDCEEAKRARELRNSIRAVGVSIEENLGVPRVLREAIKGLLEPVAAGIAENATIKVNSQTTIKIMIKEGRLQCVKTVKDSLTVDEIGGH